MLIDDDLMERLLEVATTLWNWLPRKKQDELPLFRKAIGQANFAFREATKVWETDGGANL